MWYMPNRKYMMDKTNKNGDYLNTSFLNILSITNVIKIRIPIVYKYNALIKRYCTKVIEQQNNNNKLKSFYF
jgi:hypothetical protein